MINKKKIMALLISAVLLNIPTVLSATEWVTSVLYLNVASVDELSVTVLGQSATLSATSPGQATTANVEFNSTGGSQAWVNATVIGGSTQTSGSPIYSLDNTGTTNLNTVMNISANVPTCMILKYNTTDQGNTTLRAGSTSVTTTPITLDASFTPAEAAIPIYFWLNYTSCTLADSTTRTIYFYGTTV